MEIDYSKIICLSDGRRELSPLFNSAVMGNVVNWMDVTGLKIMRTVCKFWHQKASPILQLRACVRIENDQRVTDFIHYIETIPRNEIFFRHYEIQNCYISHRPKTLEPFVQLCFPTMISLTLKYEFITEEFVHKIMFSWSPALMDLAFENCMIFPDYINYSTFTFPSEEFLCNRLQTLRINFDDQFNPDCYLLRRRHRTKAPNFPFKWKQIFKSFPNLKEITILDMDKNENTKFLNSMQKCGGKCLTGLQSLDIFGHKHFNVGSIPLRDWDLLSKLRLPHLTVLSMDVGLCIDELGFSRALGNFAPTLHKLKIWRGRIGTHLNGFPYQIKFPELKTLEVPENCANGLQFVNQMRNLRDLTITQCDTHPNSETTKIFDEVNVEKIIPLNTLTSILVEFCMDDAHVRLLEGIFPSVSKIYMLGECGPNGDEESNCESEDWDDDQVDVQNNECRFGLPCLLKRTTSEL